MINFAVSRKSDIIYGKDNVKKILFDLFDFVTIYKDKNIELTWNPVYNQLQFKILDISTINVRGGCKVRGNPDGVSRLGIFDFKIKTGVDYLFTESDVIVSSEKQPDRDKKLDFNQIWTKGLFWLGAPIDQTFPYFEITIRNNGKRCVATIANIFDVL